jgi:hypothetical protein
MAITEDQLRDGLKRKLLSNSITREEAAMVVEKWRESQSPAMTQPQPQQQPAQGPQPPVDPQQALVDTVNQKVLPGQPQPDLSAPQLGMPQQPQGMMSGAPMPAPIDPNAPKEMSLKDTIMDMFTGEQRRTKETEDMGAWSDMPELTEWSMANIGPSFKTALGTTFDSSQKNVVDVIKANYPHLEAATDAKGNVRFKSQKDGKWYGPKPGFGVSDIPAVVANVAGGVTGTRLASAVAPKAAGSILGTVVTDAATEGAMQLAKHAGGGEASMGDVALAGGLGGAMRTGGKLMKATTRYDNVINQAAAGGPEANQTLAKMFADDPEGVNAALRERGLADFDPAVGVQQEKIGIGEMLKRVDRGEADVRDLAKEMEVNPEMKAMLNENPEFAEFITTRELADPTDARTLEVFDSIATKGLNADLQAKMRTLTDELPNKISVIADSDDLGEVSKNVRELMIKKQEIFTKGADKVYEEVRQAMPSNATANPKATLDFLDAKIEDLRKANAVDDKDARKLLTGFERRVYDMLKPADGVVDPITGIRSQNMPSYHALDQLRREAGSKMASSSDEANLAKKMYALLSQDQDGAIDAMSDVLGDKIVKKAKGAKNLVSSRKALEEDMGKLFGNQFENEFLSKAKSAVNELKDSGASKFNIMLNQIPKRQRKEFTTRAILHALPKTKGGTIEFDKFGDVWASIKGNKQAMKILSNPQNMSPDGLRMLKNLGTISEGMSRSMRQKVKNVSPELVKDMVIKKQSLLKGVMDAGMATMGASGVVGLAGIIGGDALTGGAGSMAFGLATLAAFRKAARGSDEKHFLNAIDLLGSKDLKDAMMSDLSDIDVKKLSKSQQLGSFLKQAKLAKNPTEVEQWLRSSLRASQTTGAEENGNQN